MNVDPSIARICACYTEEIRAARSDEARIALFLSCVRETAADRAQSVFLLLETEAERHIDTEEHEALASRLQAARVLAGIEFAMHIGKSADPAFDRGALEHLAAVAYQAEFDRLLETVRAGGSA